VAILANNKIGGHSGQQQNRWPFWPTTKSVAILANNKIGGHSGQQRGSPDAEKSYRAAKRYPDKA
jgi:hypothetical protein